MAAEPTNHTVATAARTRRDPRHKLIAATRFAMAVFGLLMVVSAAAAAAAWWAVRSESGSAWLLSQVPNLKVSAAQGVLLGDFKAQAVSYPFSEPGPGKQAGRVDISGLAWKGLKLKLDTSQTPSIKLVVTDLQAARVDVFTAPDPSAAPLKAPSDLRLLLWSQPIEVEILRLQITQLQFSALPNKPLVEVQAQLHLGADNGQQHKLSQLSFGWERLRAQATASVATQGKLPLLADIKLTQSNETKTDKPTEPNTKTNAKEAALPWNAKLTLSGPLEQIKAQAQVQAGSAAKPQSLEALAVLRPFVAWPLADLQASTQGFDASALSSALPFTALTGKAVATSSALDQPATIQLQLSNDAAGLWNEGKLPLREVQVVVQVVVRGQANNPSTLDIQDLRATLGTSQQIGGTVGGAGRYTPERWQLKLTLAELRPALLDSRASPLQMSGPVTLTGRDFNAPGKAAIDLQAALIGQSLERSAARGKLQTAQLKLDLTASTSDGNSQGNAQGHAQGHAQSTEQRIELRQFQATIGNAKASLSGVMQRPASAPASASAPAWSVKGAGSLLDFDPLPWWSGPNNSAWRQGPHRLNAQAEFDLKLPPALWDASLSGAARAATVQGQGKLLVSRSLLAGVALQGEISLTTETSGVLKTELQLDAAGNTLRASGSVAATPDGNKSKSAADIWNLALAAPNLQALAPLWRLAQSGVASGNASGNATAFSGAINAAATVNGRWPDVTTQGQLSAAALRAGSFSAKQATARWQAGSNANAPVESVGNLVDAAVNGAMFERLQWQVKGSARAHTAELSLAAKALPPAWTDALAGMSSGASSNASAGGSASASVGGSASALAGTPAGAAKAGAAVAPSPANTQAVVNLQGGLFAVTDGQGEHPAAGWRGTVLKADAQSSHVNAPLLRARDVGAEVQWSGGPLRISVQAGQADVLGATLRWSRVAWQAESIAANGAKKPAQLEAEASLDAFPIAPVLARLQPDFGWGGDLKVKGSLQLRSAPTFSADVVLERASGDLTVTDEIGTQALELTDVRVGLNAANGTWSFTQGLAGKTLGVAAGAVVARTSPSAMWPAADAPLSGVWEVQVANLGTWGNWIPTGWRVTGGLRTSASIGGTFGAPQYTGEVRATNVGVRNFLQGVNVLDGDVLIALQGSTARIERFTAKAGAGSMSLAGSAVLGAAPQANLQLRADKFQLLGRVDRRVVASGGAQLQLDAKKVALDGNFRVDEGLIDFSRSDAPELSDDVQVVRPAGKTAPQSPDALAQAAAAEKPVSKRARDVALNLRVDLGDKLRLRGRGLDTTLQGDLRITSPDSKLALNGSVRAVEGTYAAYGQKLAIDRGTISFNGPAENPRLDIQATRPNTDVRVGVNITGYAQNPRIRLFSEPEVSEIDKLSWLVLGRPSDGLGRTDTALLQRAAMALLAGEGEGLTEQFTKAIGLDEVSLRQGEGDTRETILTLGKQLSRRWYVGYERGLNSTTGTFQLIYRIAQRFTLRAQSGSDNSLDVIWIIRWQ